jgi:hypothetical protein
MESTDDTTQRNVRIPQETSWWKRLRQNIPVILFLAAVFGGGFGAYRALLEATNQETVIKGSYVLKSDLVGTILKNEAVSEIDHLIEIGQSLGNDDAKTRIWLMQVLAFIQGLDLPRDWEWQGLKVSAIEGDIRYALEDPSIPIQAQKTLGVLKGFRAALQSRVTK